MKQTNPDTWQIPPDWHQNFEPQASLELQALRKLSQAVLDLSSDFSVELDLFEPGYLKVDVFHKQTRLAEVYANNAAAGLVYSLYAPIKSVREEEYHFRTVDEGVDILKKAVSGT
ncbi:hypothetical protein [Gimesia sp.]|uniref:hypothetical protein n=1 Tax=Gimesia sp. TaxID=2024833 RepID=UPI003A94C050